MEKAIINIIVEEHDGQISTIEQIDGTVIMLLVGLTSVIRHLEAEAPADDKMKFRTLVLEMLNDKD